MAAASAAEQATEVDWEAEEARAREKATEEIGKLDPESELYRGPAFQSFLSLCPYPSMAGLTLTNLREIPTRVFEWTQLKKLDLRGDERKQSPLGLSLIPSAIGQLANLVQLEISRNSLPTLPESLSQLTRLTLLSLKANGLIQLPSGIGNLQSLNVCGVAVSD